MSLSGKDFFILYRFLIIFFYFKIKKFGAGPSPSWDSSLLCLTKASKHLGSFCVYCTCNSTKCRNLFTIVFVSPGIIEKRSVRELIPLRMLLNLFKTYGIGGKGTYLIFLPFTSHLCGPSSSVLVYDNIFFREKKKKRRVPLPDLLFKLLSHSACAA